MYRWQRCISLAQWTSVLRWLIDQCQIPKEILYLKLIFFFYHSNCLFLNVCAYIYAGIYSSLLSTQVYFASKTDKHMTFMSFFDFPDIKFLQNLTTEWNRVSKQFRNYPVLFIRSFVSPSWGQMDSLSKGMKTTAKLIHLWDKLTLFVCLTNTVWGATLHSTMGEYTGVTMWISFPCFMASNQQRICSCRWGDDFGQNYT